MVWFTALPTVSAGTASLVGGLAAGAVSGLSSFFGGKDANEAMAREKQLDREFNIASAREAMEFNYNMSNTAYQRGVVDMQKAGLNPMLAYMRGGADSGGGTAATSSGVPHFRNVPGEAVAAGMSAREMMAKIDNIEAATSKTRAETEEVIERTPTHGQSIAESEQRIKESGERIASMSATRARELSSAAHHDESIADLQRKAPLIAAEVRKVEAEIRNIQQSTRSSSAHEDEVRQRVKANLPEVQRLLTKIKAELHELEKPGAMRAADIRSTEFFGNFGALVRILTGR